MIIYGASKKRLRRASETKERTKKTTKPLYYPRVISAYIIRVFYKVLARLVKALCKNLMQYKKGLKNRVDKNGGAIIEKIYIIA